MMKKCIFILGLSAFALFAVPLYPTAEELQNVWPTASVDDDETIIIETQAIDPETGTDDTVSIVPTYPLEEDEQSSSTLHDAEAEQSLWLPADDEAVIIETQAIDPETGTDDTVSIVPTYPLEEEPRQSSLPAATTDQSLWPTASERVIMDASVQEAQKITEPAATSKTVRNIMPQQQEKSLWPTAPVKQRNAPSKPAASAEEAVLLQHHSGDLEFPPANLQDGKDDIINTIQEAVQQYRSKDFAGAISNLDYAAHLIRQKKSELLKALLPEPFYGWQADAPVSQSLGIAVFGGGSTISRDYSAQSGASVSIEIVSDSPVLQSIIMMLNNPLFAGASGGNLKTIKRQRAMIKYDHEERSGEINIVVANRFIVTVKGKNIDLVWLLRYAEAIDFETLAKN
jgi:hypothetical protein